MVILEVRDVVKSFGGLRALQDVNLSVAKGEIRAVIGPNGAGKSTLFNVMTGLLSPDTGNVVFDGLVDTPEQRKAVPVEILPIKGVMATLFTESILFIGFYVYLGISGQLSSWINLLLPVLIIIQAMAMLGMSYFLSAVSVFFRDTKDFIQVFITVGLFAMPVLFQLEQVPEKVRFVFYLNPFSYMVWCYRDIFVAHSFEHPWAWLVFPLLSLIALIYGYRFFIKFRPMFSGTL